MENFGKNRKFWRLQGGKRCILEGWSWKSMLFKMTFLITFISIIKLCNQIWQSILPVLVPTSKIGSFYPWKKAKKICCVKWTFADFWYVILWHLIYRWAKIQHDNFLFHVTAIFWLFSPVYIVFASFAAIWEHWYWWDLYIIFIFCSMKKYWYVCGIDFLHLDI